MSKGNLVVPPDIGIDVGVSITKGKFVVSSSDPITGTLQKMGWHAVNVSANDVATSGIMPDTLNVVALFPKRTSVNAIKKLIAEINKTALDLGITVAGGHTEITPGLNRPIIAITAMGSGDRFVTAANARQNDSMLMTKTAGIEGTSILAKLPKVRSLVGASASRRGAGLLEKLSIIQEAKAAFDTGKIHAMHDVTEGGILGAAYEMSVASNLGFELLRDSVPVESSTSDICKKLSVDPLRLIGSGSLLIACSRVNETLVKDQLVSKKISCAKIGRFLPQKKGRWLIGASGRKRVTESSIHDELWDALGKYSKFP
ncbi:MAG: AIR synthase-related protein [Nitrososphaerales archaeon]